MLVLVCELDLLMPAWTAHYTQHNPNPVSRIDLLLTLPLQPCSVSDYGQIV